MGIGKRTVITIEGQRLQVISRRRIDAHGWCNRCARQVQLVTADAAAELTGVTTRVIFQRVEAGSIHFIETQDGLLLICTASLN